MRSETSKLETNTDITSITHIGEGVGDFGMGVYLAYSSCDKHPKITNYVCIFSYTTYHFA